jgi:hypothetical protein
MMSPGWRHRVGTEFLAFEAKAVKDGNGSVDRSMGGNRVMAQFTVNASWLDPYKNFSFA